MEEKYNTTIDENAAISPQTKKPINRKVLVPELLIILVLVSGFFYFLYQKNSTSSQKKNANTQISRNQLSGQIIFSNKQGFQSLDVKTGKVSYLFNGGGFDWQFRNNYIFLSSSSAVVRFSLATHKKDSISVSNIGSSQLDPSPDGQKVYVLNHAGYPGDPTPPQIFVYNFLTRKRLYLPLGAGLIKWLPDSTHVILSYNSKIPSLSLPGGGNTIPSQKMFVYNLNTGKQVFLFEGLVGSMAISEKGNTLLWYSDIVSNYAQITRESPKPVLYKTTLHFDTDTIGRIVSIPGSKIPVNQDVYYAGSLIGNGFSTNKFFMTVGQNKDIGIFTLNTDNEQIRKITPSGFFSYYMEAYNLSLDKVLAYKYPDEMYPVNLPPSQIRGYKYKPSVVLVNAKGNVSEKIITGLDGLLPNAPFVFSPDNKFIIGPKYSDQVSNSGYTIYSLQNPAQSLSVTTDLGRKIYWIK